MMIPELKVRAGHVTPAIAIRRSRQREKTISEEMQIRICQLAVTFPGSRQRESPGVALESVLLVAPAGAEYARRDN
jgi:hypothetical protein